MPGKRLSPEQRALRPSEDRARQPSEDRGRRKRKMRARKESDGLTEHDRARLRAWENAE